MVDTRPTCASSFCIVRIVCSARNRSRSELVVRARELFVRVAKLRRARQRQRLGHQPHEEDGGRDRRRRRDRLDDAGEPIRAVPQRPELHQVRRPATQDEDAEHQEHPLERKVRALADEVHERERDQIVRHRDDGVRDRMEPDDLRIPEKTDTVRHEVRREEVCPEFGHGVCSRCLCNGRW
jgi:hypothetical protein